MRQSPFDHHFSQQFTRTSRRVDGVFRLVYIAWACMAAFYVAILGTAIFAVYTAYLWVTK